MAEADLKEAGLEVKPPLSPILGRTSPIPLPSGYILGGNTSVPSNCAASQPSVSSVSGERRTTVGSDVPLYEREQTSEEEMARVKASLKAG